jgi:UDPglucose--hexose-1-phosphate uridylyltransferase
VSTLRQDPTTKEWVIVATGRADRPHVPVKLERPVLPERDPSCPFCPGNEEKTPPETTRTPQGPDWRVRVVPNMYPAVRAEGSVERNGFGIFRAMDGFGAHEVIVESPRHDARFDEMADGDLAEVLGVWRERYRALEDLQWSRAVVLFKNFGAMAGTSLVHPHSQIVALPVYTPEALHRQNVATRYYDDTGHCVYEDVVHNEVAERVRLVSDEGRFIAFAPWASRVPFEIWIVPTSKQPSFALASDQDLADVAALLRRVLAALREAAGDPDFNLVVSTPPGGHENEPACIWNLRMVPRLSTAAGFELGSGMDINTVAPEAAAESLREAIASAS